MIPTSQNKWIELSPVKVSIRETEIRNQILGYSILLNTLIENENNTVIKFIFNQLKINHLSNFKVSLKNRGVYELNGEDVNAFVNLNIINYNNDINKYYSTVNEKLPNNGVFIGCVESLTERKERLSKTYTSLIKPIWFFDFILNRVIPKIPITKHIYSFFTNGEYNVVSTAETLGRLSFSGFTIISHQKIGGKLYFAAYKTKAPLKDESPSSGVLYKMPRVSKGGKIIGIYKLRSMHPYSEYIQDYLVRINGYDSTGKPNNDFRLTSWGKVMRKLHVDEMPQLLNVAKGELNIIGVRPLSKFGYNALPLDLQIERIKYKPGCIPPSISIGVNGFEGVIKAERIYLRTLSRKQKLMTNIKYFYSAVLNLVKRKHVSA